MIVLKYKVIKHILYLQIEAFRSILIINVLEFKGIITDENVLGQ